MLNILQEFAFGNINPNERSFKRGTEYEKTAKALMESEQKLIDSLNEEEKALFDQFSAYQMKFSTLENAEKFVLGFRIGALMIMDVMEGKDDLIF